MKDPRSPSMKRTPLSTPVHVNGKQHIRASSLTEFDPRSPGLQRTPMNDVIAPQYGRGIYTMECRCKQYTNVIMQLILHHLHSPTLTA